METRLVRPRRSDAESGQILVLTAVTMVALLAIAALSLDASFMYDKRNRLHAAADAAAKTALIEWVRNPAVTQASLEKFADQQVFAHGFTSTRLGGTATVVISNGPTKGPFAGVAGYVEAVVSEPTSTFFAKIIGWTSMTPSATAVAGPAPPTNCFITTHGLNIGNTILTLDRCGAAVGGNLDGTDSNAQFTGSPLPTVAVSGTWNGVGSLGSVTTAVPSPTDPLVNLVPPPTPKLGDCVAGVAPVLPSGCYTSIATTVKALTTGGIYYVTGDLNIDTLTGSEVLIYLAPGGQLRAGNNAQLHLTAPTTGTYTGVAIFQDPGNSNNFEALSLTLDVKGVIYMPGADVNFSSPLTFAPTECSLFIARSLTIGNGSGSLTTRRCANNYGPAAFLSVTIVQ